MRIPIDESELERKKRGGFWEWAGACASSWPGQWQPLMSVSFALQTHLYAYFAFETNPQGHPQLSSSTTCGVFRRSNCSYLSVSLFFFPADRCSDRMSTSFWAGVDLLFSPLPLWLYSATSPFVSLLHLTYTCMYTFLSVAWFDPALLCLENLWLSRPEWARCLLSCRPSPVAQRSHCFINEFHAFSILLPLEPRKAHGVEQGSQVNATHNEWWLAISICCYLADLSSITT